MIVTIPFALVVLVLDVPFVLLGSIEDLILYNITLEKLSSSFIVMWMNILNGGGRMVISIVAVLMTVIIYGKIYYLFPITASKERKS